LGRPAVIAEFIPVMAVEFRCPECRAKLRLTDAPEPGEEVECPKCSHVFPAPDNGIEFRSSKKKPAGSAAKKPADDEADEKPEPKPEKKPEKKAAGPKKRRVRKKEVNKTLLYSVAGGGVALVIAISCLLFWYFSRVPIPFQMMAYLPEDSKLASGVNVGHIQKYAEFAKTVQQASNDKAFWKAGEVMKSATGPTWTTPCTGPARAAGSSGSSGRRRSSTRRTCRSSPGRSRTRPTGRRTTRPTTSAGSAG